MSSPSPSNIYEPRTFLETVAGIQRNVSTSSADRPHLIAVIDPAYTTGNPKVTFEGESTMSGKEYAFLSSYTPVASDRVVLAPLGTSYVIIGSIGVGGGHTGNYETTDGWFRAVNDATTDPAFLAGEPTDSFNRYQVETSGRITWGDGANARDTNLYRSAVGNRVKTDDDFEVGGQLIIAAQTFTVFTPTSTSHGPLAWQTRTGWYWKLGKLVFFTAHFDVSVAGTGTTVWQPGLPSTPDRSIIAGRQRIGVTTEGVFSAGSPVELGTGSAIIFDTGSGAIVDRVRAPHANTHSATTNSDLNITGADLLVDALITIEGWYKEA